MAQALVTCYLTLRTTELLLTFAVQSLMIKRIAAAGMSKPDTLQLETNSIDSDRDPVVVETSYQQRWLQCTVEAITTDQQQCNCDVATVIHFATSADWHNGTIWEQNSLCTDLNILHISQASWVWPKWTITFWPSEPWFASTCNLLWPFQPQHKPKASAALFLIKKFLSDFLCKAKCCIFSFLDRK